MEVEEAKGKGFPIENQNPREGESVMKDQLITILEACGLAKAELRAHEKRRVKNGPRTVKRLKEILFDDRCDIRLCARLDKASEAPSVVPPRTAGPAVSVSSSPTRKAKSGHYCT